MDSLANLLKNRKFYSAQWAERTGQVRPDDVTQLEQTLVNTIVAFHDEAAKIRGTYKPEIAAEKLEERAEQILRQMDSGPGSLLRQIGRRWATGLKTLEKQSGLTESTDPSVTAKEMWVLDRLREMDKTKRLPVLHDAIERRDAVTLRAVLHAPRAFAVVDDKLAEELRQAWYTKHLPAEAAEYTSAYEHHEIAKGNFEVAQNCIREIVGTAQTLRDRLEAAHPTGQANA